MNSADSFQTRKEIRVGSETFTIFSLQKLEKALNCNLSRLPFSLRILLENLLRCEDGNTVKKEDIEKLAHWDSKANQNAEISFMPARVLLQDFTGIPCIVDLAIMRDTMVKLKEDPTKINPLIPVDLVIDHSVQVDEYGTKTALQTNTTLEFERNKERYSFLRWGQNAFKNFRVIPPGTGIVHQVNLEYLASVVFKAEENNKKYAYPDTVVGTDSHTTMINGLGILGWGVGGIEAEAAMLGQPISMLIPQVVGLKLIGELKPGVTATDLVLTITQLLRKKGVVGKFVEFFGPSLNFLSVADRATIANMAPEYGATVGFFPADSKTIEYLRSTGRSNEQIELTEIYLKEQKLFSATDIQEPEFSNIIELNLSTVEPSIAGPKRPQDRMPLKNSKPIFRSMLIDILKSKGFTIDMGAVADWVYYSQEHAKPSSIKSIQVDINGSQYELEHGAIALAAITSCTNTSNPQILVAAGLLAKKAIEKGLKTKPWVKTSFAPGSKVVTQYLSDSGLMEPLEQLGFHLVGYGCTTCIGNSGPLPEPISKAIKENSLVTTAVLSGNRNFEGRINPLVQMSYLASPPLVIAYAIAGTVDIDLFKEPLGIGNNGEPILLKDIWPSQDEINQIIQRNLTPDIYKTQYANVIVGNENWQNLEVKSGTQYEWIDNSTYIRPTPFFDDFQAELKPLTNIYNARVLVLLGDSITTDHISPAGSIDENSPAGKYLLSAGIQPADFNQYGARRGNHEVMMRGTFANVRLKNLLVPDMEGNYTLMEPSSIPMPIYDAAMQYKESDTPLIIIAGKEYGSGSSRDWAAKGPALLGVKAVIAESFERIHRSNLIGMGILPLQFEEGQNHKSLGISGFETFDIQGIAEDLYPKKKMNISFTSKDGVKKNFSVVCRLDTPNEIEYFRHGGILQFVLRSKLKPQVASTETQSSVVRSESASAKKYRVLFRGEIVDGYDIKKVKESLARLLKTTPAQIENFFTGKTTTLNTNLSHSAAATFVVELEKIGVLSYFEPIQLQPPSPQPTAAAKPIRPAQTGKPYLSIKSKSVKPLHHTADVKSSSGFLTAVMMILLVLLYPVLVLGIATALVIHIVEGTNYFSEYSLLKGSIMYFVPILIGILLLISAIKPFIARPSVKKYAVPLMKRKDFPLLKQIEKICNALGFRKQFNIELDYSNALQLKYKGGFIGVLEKNLVLTIGIPLLAEMTISEFLSLLTCEIKPFAKKDKTSTYLLIRGINNWFRRVVYEEDETDQKMRILSRTGNSFISLIAVPIARFFVWLLKKILFIFMTIGNTISKPYLQKVELDAIKTSVNMIGFEPFENALGKLHLIADATEKAMSQLLMQKQPQDSSLPNNFMQLISHDIHRMSEEEIKRIKQSAGRILPKTASSRLTDHERLEFARRISSKATEQIDQPDEQASNLLPNFDELASIASIGFYKEVMGLKVDKNSLISTKQFISSVELYETTKTPSAPATAKAKEYQIPKDSTDLNGLIDLDENNPNPFA